MVINIIRGTGWRGVCALRDHERVRRPLLGMSKAEIVRYAIDHGLLWRDDETNDNPRYLRNAIRQIIMRRLTPAQRAAWVRLYDAQRHVSAGIAEASRAVAPLAIHDGELSRYYISMVDRSVAHELITLWCGQRLESRARDRLWHFACTALPGKRTHERGLSIVAARRGIRIVSPSDIC